ncbi:MAG: hypothetical protein JO031_10260 [Ktedonobacteraceae bacterium]|nr:hypothetical protein [Ktedonobacteraceae bacterium]
MFPSVQATKDQSPSGKAEQLAAAYQLGTPQQEYRVRYTRMILVCGIISLLLWFGFAFLAYNMYTSPRNINDSNNVPIVIGVGVMFLLIGLYCLLYPVLYRSWHVYVYSEGFAFTKGSKVDAFRWDQIDCMWQAITRRYMNGIYMGTLYKYTVRGMNGRQVVLNNRIADVGSLGAIISDMVTRVKLPQVLAAFRAGQTITFGRLSVSLQGVSNGKELVPWSQIKEIGVSRGYVTVRKEGKWLSWSSVQVAKIPNFFIFFALVNTIMKTTR